MNSVQKKALDALINHYKNTNNRFLSWMELARLVHPDATGNPLRAHMKQIKQRKFKIKELATENGYTLISNRNEKKSRVLGIKLAKIEDAQFIKIEIDIMKKAKTARELSMYRYARGAQKYIELAEKKQQLQLEIS